MIKFKATTDDGKTIVGLGLSEGNLEKLKQSKPIVVWLQEIGIEYNIEICIFYGKTEQEMYDKMKNAGLLKGTIIHKENQKI